MTNNFFRKPCRLSHNVEKYCTVKKKDDRRQYNTAHELCMLDKYGYTHPPRTYNSYCFCRATTVMRKCPNITFIRRPNMFVFLLPCNYFRTAFCSFFANSLKFEYSGVLFTVP